MTHQDGPGFVWPCCGQRKTSGVNDGLNESSCPALEGGAHGFYAPIQGSGIFLPEAKPAAIWICARLRGWSNPVFFAATTITTATARKRSQALAKWLNIRRNPKIRKREPVALGAADYPRMATITKELLVDMPGTSRQKLKRLVDSLSAPTGPPAIS